MYSIYIFLEEREASRKNERKKLINFSFNLNIYKDKILIRIH
jgi:hypothetical protein